MEYQNQTKKTIPNPNPNPNPNSAAKVKKKKSDEFDFCKVCKLNHDHGRRHNYFPNHVKSLSSFLSRFQHKLSDVRFFLKNPSLLRPEHASRNRLWCVFCDSDIDELGSSFACGNAINHLASAGHLKILKGFLWKYGGSMDRLDSFRILEADLTKWEGKCKSMQSEAATGGSRGPLIGPVNDIHNELTSEYIDTFDKNTIHSLNSNFLNGVMPLQYYTNEKYQVPVSEISEFTEVGPSPHDANSSFHVGTQMVPDPRGLNGLTGYMGGGRSVLHSGRTSSADGCNDRVMYQVSYDEKGVNEESSSQGLLNLTQISSKVREQSGGNVHSGAPPPWLDGTEENTPNVGLKAGLGLSFVPSQNKSGKSQKLNPKRVGAAWAEKRKIELEMEKRGELVTNNFDANWLPNFGRVWQSGTRRESRKEFEVENKKLVEVESESEASIKIQPYVSKRMRRDAGE